jgi:hypothetical protein
MSFWTGLEALSGHRPGAFTGFSMKDLFEKDMWDRLPRTWSGKMGTPAHLKANPMDQRLGRDGEPMMTNWYNRNAGSGPTDSVNQNIDRRMQGLYHQNLGAYPSMNATYPAMPAQAQMFPYKRQDVKAVPIQAHIPGVSPTQGLDSIRQWGGGNPNTPRMMWGDPTFSGIPGQLGTRWGAGLGAPTVTPPMLDKTTVVTESDNPNEFNTKKTTYKQQVPANPTRNLMNMGMSTPTSELVGGGEVSMDRIREMLRVLEGMKARRGY